MKDSVVSRPDTEGVFFPARGFRWFLLLVAIVVGALVLRFHCIGHPPVSFHPTRQYRNALIAQAIYVKHDLASSRQPILEPPLTEGMAVGLYTILGRESLAAARAMSIVWWMLAAVFLYLLTKCAVSRDGAVIAVLFFLFLPYAVLASRSFQPDPLMIMLFIGATWSIFRLRQTPSGRWLTTAVGLSAAAIFVKPVCVFPILLMFLSTGVFENGIRATLKSVWTWLYLALSLLPTLAYYGYGLFVADFLRWQADASFLPRLLLERSFWGDWLRLASHVIGGAALFVALLGIPLAPSRLTKGLLVGLWSGYVVMGLIFTFHIHTHDYYHMQLIPIAALSLGVVAAIVLERLARLSEPWKLAAFGVLTVALVLQSDKTWRELRQDDGGDAWAALNTQIGNCVAHSAKTVFLAPDYGNSLMYYGGVAGTWWPYRYAMPYPPERIQENLDRLIAQQSPEYFIVTAIGEFEQEPNLQKALAKYPLVLSTDACRVFDLRSKVCRATSSGRQ